MFQLPGCVGNIDKNLLRSESCTLKKIILLKFYYLIRPNLSSIVGVHMYAKGMTFIEAGICHRTPPLRTLFTVNLIINFQSQTFQVSVLTSKRWKVQTLLLPSDKKKSDINLPAYGATANVVHRDLDLNFQGHTF